MDISPARKLPLLVAGGTATDHQLLQQHAALLGRLAGIEPPQLLAVDAIAPPSASAVVGDMTLLVPMAGLIDPAAELARLGKRLDKNRQEITKATAKLSNANFVANAPPEVVATERERIAQFEKVNESLARQIEVVQGLLQTS
jgi:valyl-tRNA synthetase